MTAPMHLPMFYLRQRFAMATNRYEVRAPGPDGGEGDLLGLAEQKRMALKERVTFYADETRQRRVFSFQARQRLDLGAEYDITDEGGQPLGYFKKDFGASLIRSTFTLAGPGYEGVGQERNMGVALVRRFVDIPFLPMHFDFSQAGGQPLMAVDRARSVRDRYTVHVPDPRVDFRVAAALAVALDALMDR